ncbi:hypothetical protein [Arthrobacter sp. S41]|uniref:hypothetical protein n=1 Tax=Arthrobacter sp. S41 TaxID=2509721 RepID=UPI001036DCC3|nr:hypothetical protein [Arthrobacter sp. S41]TAP27637.1 hypothetical protein EYR88_04670 [Arthrobacter sp. S41]
MDISDWVSVQREDGETVGYLQPVTPDYSLVIPRNILGHAIAEPHEYSAAEYLLEERGIAELMSNWRLDAQEQEKTEELTILEVSPLGIVLANALRVKALEATERIHVMWPDVEQRLTVTTKSHR